MYAQKMPILILPRREENTTEADHITELNQLVCVMGKGGRKKEGEGVVLGRTGHSSNVGSQLGAICTENAVN
jgi:hypothetical protein